MGRGPGCGAGPGDAALLPCPPPGPQTATSHWTQCCTVAPASPTGSTFGGCAPSGAPRGDAMAQGLRVPDFLVLPKHSSGPSVLSAGQEGRIRPAKATTGPWWVGERQQNDRCTALHCTALHCTACPPHHTAQPIALHCSLHCPTCPAALLTAAPPASLTAWLIALLAAPRSLGRTKQGRGGATYPTYPHVPHTTSAPRSPTAAPGGQRCHSRDSPSTAAATAEPHRLRLTAPRGR